MVHGSWLELIKTKKVRYMRTFFVLRLQRH